MENEINDEENVLESQGNEEPETSAEDFNNNQDDGEDVDAIKSDLQKAKELANNYKIRAEKAEKAVKQVKFAEPQVKTKIVGGELTTKDLYALMEAKVPEEDIDEVAKIAKIYQVSIPEALKLSLTKTFLSEKSEQRQTASAANVGSSKRSSGRISDEILLSKAQKGELPDNDSDLERLIVLRKMAK